MKWRRREAAEAEQAKAEAARALRRTKVFTRHIERIAPVVASLSPEEFAERVRTAFEQPPERSTS